MRWIEERRAFEEALLLARDCKYADSGRHSTSLARLVFDDAINCTKKFPILIHELLRRSGDAYATYLVLDPDPILYFHHHFARLPAFSFEQTDTPEDWLNQLNYAPDGSLPDAIGTNCFEWVVRPHSSSWFVHFLRHEADQGGHLWLPGDWADSVCTQHPWLQG